MATRTFDLDLLSTAQRLEATARRTIASNLRTRGVMASPPTVTQDGTSLPSGQTLAFLRSTYADLYQPIGGQFIASGAAGGRVLSSRIGTTGGNIGLNDGSQASYSRVPLATDAAKISFRVGRSANRYRFIVGGQYVDTTGTLTSAATPTSTDEYISLDFGSAAPLGREIMVEMQGDCRFVGAYVPASAMVWTPSLTAPRSVLLLDSYGVGSNATHLADAFGAIIGDYLGTRHTNSGSVGTGWATAGSAYRFDQRIANGDLSLSGTPDLVILGGSYNDRNSDAATIEANATAGLEEARALHPMAIIAVLGAFPGGSGPSAGIIAAENAVKAAVEAVADDYTFFIPVSTAAKPWISGTGNTGATTGTGNSDIYTDADGVHPPNAGHAHIGQRAASAILAGLQGLLAA